MREKLVKYFIISTFIGLYFSVSLISTIHVVEFFELTNPRWLAISLAVAFELGAAASLASIIALDKMNQALVWALFITLTLMQSMGNSYWAYSHAQDFSSWSELFGLSEEDLIYQKRILSLISGAILPLVALGFIKSLVDYIRPANQVNANITDQQIKEKEETELEMTRKQTSIDLTDPSENQESVDEISEAQETEEIVETATKIKEKPDEMVKPYPDPAFEKYISGKPYPTNLR